MVILWVYAPKIWEAIKVLATDPDNRKDLWGGCSKVVPTCEEARHDLEVLNTIADAVDNLALDDGNREELSRQELIDAIAERSQGRVSNLPSEQRSCQPDMKEYAKTFAEHVQDLIKEEKKGGMKGKGHKVIFSDSPTLSVTRRLLRAGVNLSMICPQMSGEDYAAMNEWPHVQHRPLREVVEKCDVSSISALWMDYGDCLWMGCVEPMRDLKLVLKKKILAKDHAILFISIGYDPKNVDEAINTGLQITEVMGFSAGGWKRVFFQVYDKSKMMLIGFERKSEVAPPTKASKS